MARFVTRTNSLSFDKDVVIDERALETIPLRRNKRQRLRTVRGRLTSPEAGGVKREFKHIGLRHRCCIEPVSFVGTTAAVVAAYYTARTYYDTKRNNGDNSALKTFEEWVNSKTKANCQHFINHPADKNIKYCKSKILDSCLVFTSKRIFSLSMTCSSNHIKVIAIPKKYLPQIMGKK